MQLQGGIWRFAQKYGISEKHTNRIQLCTEELIYEMLYGAVFEDDVVDMDIHIRYSEVDKSIRLELICAGKEFNPFLLVEDNEVHLGVTILRNVAKEILHTYRDGMVNQINITL